MITKTISLSPKSLPYQVAFGDGAIATLESENNLFKATLSLGNTRITLPPRETLKGLYEFAEEGEGHWLAVNVG